MIRIWGHWLSMHAGFRDIYDTPLPFHAKGHDLGQRVRIIQKRNCWVDLKILYWKVSFCGFKESQERILQLDHFCSHWSIKLPIKFFAPIMRYTTLTVLLNILQGYKDPPLNKLYCWNLLASRLYWALEYWSSPKTIINSLKDKYTVFFYCN